MTRAEKIKARASCQNRRRNIVRIKQAVRGGWSQDTHVRGVEAAHSGLFEKFVEECPIEAERLLKNV